jgi:hypothetical protein
MGQQKQGPTAESLLEAFEVLDRKGNGRILEQQFRRIMMVRMAGEEEELEEMIVEYKRQHPPNPTDDQTKEEESYIEYKNFVAMLRLA